MAFASDLTTDPLLELEDRIRRTVELIPRLREEKAIAEQERESALQDAAEARTRADHLLREVEALRVEREQVRARVEKLLAQMEALSGE